MDDWGRRWGVLRADILLWGGEWTGLLRAAASSISTSRTTKSALRLTLMPLSAADLKSARSCSSVRRSSIPIRERAGSNAMLSFTKMSINRKLTMIILLTCTAVLLLAGLAMIATEIVTSRRAMIEDMTALADVLSRNSTAALSFHREEDADEVRKTLSSLQADPHILAASLFDKAHQRFGEYIRADASRDVPIQPPPDGYRFTSGYLELAHPVELNKKRIGTIYLRSDLGRIYPQVPLHAGIVGGGFVSIRALA